MGLELILIALLVCLILHQIRALKRPKRFSPGRSGVPILGYIPFLAPDSHIKLGRFGQKYGNIFSIKLGDYWFVVLNDFELIRTAFQEDAFSGRPNHLIPMAIAKRVKFGYKLLLVLDTMKGRVGRSKEDLYTVHHDEKYWDEPESFNPDRFISPDGSFKKDERVVIPFSIGKRVCMAESFAHFISSNFFTCLNNP